MEFNNHKHVQLLPFNAPVVRVIHPGLRQELPGKFSLFLNRNGQVVKIRGESFQNLFQTQVFRVVICKSSSHRCISGPAPSINT